MSLTRVALLDSESIVCGRGKVTGYGTSMAEDAIWVDVEVQWVDGGSASVATCLFHDRDGVQERLYMGIKNAPATARVGDTIHLESSLQELFA